MFSFDLPAEHIRVVDRILVINISPDPPGFSNDAVMTIVDAGVPPREVVQVQFNIQPDECPNRIYLSNRPGIVRAAILGTDDFDVTEVAANTLELEELGPDRSFVRDVTSARKSPLDCDDEGERDGKRDLVLEFPRDRLSGLLITPPQNEVTTMKIFGFLRDGTTLMIGEDVTLLRR